MDSSNRIINESFKYWVKWGWGRGDSHNLKISSSKLLIHYKGKSSNFSVEKPDRHHLNQGINIDSPYINPNGKSSRFYLQNVHSQTAIIPQLEVTVHLLKGVPASPCPPVVRCQPAAREACKHGNQIISLLWAKPVHALIALRTKAHDLTMATGLEGPAPVSLTSPSHCPCLLYISLVAVSSVHQPWAQ